MRKEFRRVLKEQFSKKFLTHEREFSEFKGKSEYRFSRDTVFVKRPRETNAWLFIILIADEKREAFTVEIGWSTLLRFPELSPRPSGRPTRSRDEFRKVEFVCRLRDLYDIHRADWPIQPPFNPFTDDFLQFVKNSTAAISTEDAVALVGPQVDDSLGKLKQFGLPYLEEYIRSTHLQ